MDITTTSPKPHHSPDAAATTTKPAPTSSAEFTLRRSQHPTDMQKIVAAHSRTYKQQLGWGDTFVELVAGITDGFVADYDASCEQCWIAERSGEDKGEGGFEREFLGCVMVVRERATRHPDVKRAMGEEIVGKAAVGGENKEKEKEREKNTIPTARLRVLLVQPEARGMGVGAALVRQCTEFARDSGYKKIVLWTNDTLTAARRLYQREGYELAYEEQQDMFGIRFTGQHWEKRL